MRDSSGAGGGTRYWLEASFWGGIGGDGGEETPGQEKLWRLDDFSRLLLQPTPPPSGNFSLPPPPLPINQFNHHPNQTTKSTEQNTQTPRNTQKNNFVESNVPRR